MTSDHKPEKGTAMSAKDRLGVIFSLAALAISSASYYNSNIRVDDNTSARITDMRVEAAEPNDSTNGYKNGNIVLKVTIANVGNRPAIVTGATFQLSNQPDLSNGGFGNEVLTEAGVFPMLIAAKDLRLVNLKIPIKTVLQNFASGGKVASSAETNGRELRKFFAGLRYEAIDSAGNLHTAWSGMEVAIIVSSDRWDGLGKTNQREPFSLTPLLR